MRSETSKKIKKIIKDKYSKIAVEESNCCCSCDCDSEDTSRNIGYSDDDIAKGKDANLGLGCGNPVGLSRTKKGYDQRNDRESKDEYQEEKC